MIQLELDPMLMPGGRNAEEIKYWRDRILRMSGRGRQGGENRYHSITRDEALLSLAETSYLYFGQLSEGKGYNIELWADKALSKALPFLEGVEGEFRSFNHFRNTMFDNLLYHLAIDRHRKFLRGEQTDDDKSATKEVMEKREKCSFQPSLFRFRKTSELLEDVQVDQLLADLDNPRRVLYKSGPDLTRKREQIFSSWDPDYFAGLEDWAKEAIRLWIYNPSLVTRDITTILKDRGYTVTADAIRMMRSRGKKSSLNKLPIERVGEVVQVESQGNRLRNLLRRLLFSLPFGSNPQVET